MQDSQQSGDIVAILQTSPCRYRGASGISTNVPLLGYLLTRPSFPLYL